MLDSAVGIQEKTPQLRDIGKLAARLVMLTELPIEDPRRVEIESFWRSILDVLTKRENLAQSAKTYPQTDKFGKTKLMEGNGMTDADQQIARDAYEAILSLFKQSSFQYCRSNGETIDPRKAEIDPQLAERVTDFGISYMSHDPRRIAAKITYPTEVVLENGRILKFSYRGKDVMCIEKLKNGGDITVVATPAFQRDRPIVELRNAQGIFQPLIHSLAWHNTDTTFAKPSFIQSSNIRSTISLGTSSPNRIT